MFIYQIIKFNCEDGVICNAKIVKTYDNLKSAKYFIQLNNLSDKKAEEYLNEHPTFSDNPVYQSAIFNEDEDCVYFNIIESKIDQMNIDQTKKCTFRLCEEICKECKGGTTIYGIDAKGTATDRGFIYTEKDKIRYFCCEECCCAWRTEMGRRDGCAIM